MLLNACPWAHGEGKETTMSQLTLTSPSFRNNQPIPAKFSCEGEDASPALKWEGAPAGTKSFALICDDPDAPGGTWVHWVVYGLPSNAVEMPEDIGKGPWVGKKWQNGEEVPSGWFVSAQSGGVGAIRPIAEAEQGINDFGKPGYGGPCPPKGSGVRHYHFRLYALDTDLKLAAGIKRSHLDSVMKGHIIEQVELVGTYQRE
jgi:Raf kinase inhibitor-like YbhB/YbcL family protein